MAVSFDFGVVNFGSINEGGFATNPVPLGVEVSENSFIGTDTRIWTIIRDAYPTASFTETTFTLDFLYPDFANSDFESATVEIRRNDSTQFQAQIALFTNDDNLDEPDEAFSLQQPTVVIIDIRDSSRGLLARFFPDDIAALYASVGGLTAIGQVTGTIIDNDLPPNTAPTAVNFIDTTPDLNENSDTTSRIKVADVTITDDGQGTNVLSLTGSDADAFELEGTVLYLKAGTTLDYESGKTSYSVTVNVDDPTVGNTPDLSKTFTLSINDVNENLPPIAQNDLITTDANTPIAFNLFADNGNGPDSDPNGDTFKVSDTNYPSNFQGNVEVFFDPGAASYDPAGVFDYLAAGETATTGFTYTITDGTAISDVATVTITVTGVNDNPTDLTLSNTTVAENSDLGTVIGNFSTVDPDTSNTTFTYSLVDTANFPDNSAFSITDNQLRVNTNLDFETKSSYNIRVKTTDAGGLSFEKVLTIGVNDVAENRTPTAVNDSVSAYRGVPTTIAASTLLANDTDPDAGTTLKITGVSNATNGTVSLNSSGNVVFTATNTGDASFQYTISDGSLTSTATVAVSVGLSLNGGNRIDILKGSDRDDLINGNGGADALYGNKGNDILNGGSSLDLLLGGEGNDLLNGGDSADALYGGKGNDTLTGGSGKDLFAFTAGDGSDTITDFADGSDRIGLVGLRFSQLTISASGSSTVIKYGSETLATLTGVSSNLITAADFIPA